MTVGYPSLPRSRKDAKAAGSTRYFASLECKNGHISDRLTSTGQCLVCVRAQKLDWYHRHSEAENAFVRQHHRHHRGVIGHKFSIGAEHQGKVIGVVIVGRPVARGRDDGFTLEVTRLCTDGTKNACSFLYGAAARGAFALGYRRIGTYILKDEKGVSLKAARWRLIGERGGGSWSCPSRPRVDTHPLQGKLLFEKEQH